MPRDEIPLRDRLRAVGGVGLRGIGMAAAAVAVALFVAVMLGGGIYRTTCTGLPPDGGTITSWGLEGNIPYTWSPNDDRCTTHTLTRYVLGKIGIQSDVSE